jgi:endonuclease YncB( thermonuclease family)
MLTLSLLLASAEPSPTCRVVDGDTIRCGSNLIRLLGIDAPEMGGRCRRGRRCAPGDPIASKASLARAMRLGPIRIIPVTRDRYRRTVALVSAGGVDLSCWQLRRGQAIYKPTWDDGARVRTTCLWPGRPARN